jgi:plasmid replication initiation protein
MKYLCLWCFIVLVLLTTIEGLVVKVAPRNQTVGLRTRSPTLEISKYTAWTGGASFNVDFRIRVDELDLQAVRSMGSACACTTIVGGLVKLPSVHE